MYMMDRVYIFNYPYDTISWAPKAPARKSSENVCISLIYYLINVSIRGNSVDPDQTAPMGAIGSESTLFAKKASKTVQQTTKAFDFCCDWCFNG